MTYDDYLILCILACLAPFAVIGFILNKEQEKSDAEYLKEYGKERHPKKKKKY